MKPSEIEHLYVAHVDSVYRFVYYRVRHRQLAEDIVADSFRKIIEHGATYHPQAGASVRSWMFAIVRNTITDHFRKQKFVLPADVSEIEIPVDAHHETAVDLSLDLERVLTQLDYLPESQQECVLLRLQAGLSNAEIASLLGISDRTVSAHISRAIATLHTSLYERI